MLHSNIVSAPQIFCYYCMGSVYKSGTIQSRQNKNTLLSLDAPIHLHILFLQILSATTGLGEAIANDMDISHQYLHRKFSPQLQYTNRANIFRHPARRKQRWISFRISLLDNVALSTPPYFSLLNRSPIALK